MGLVELMMYHLPDGKVPDDKELMYIQECLGYQLFPSRDLPVPPAGIDWKKLVVLLERHHLDAFFYSLSSVLGSSWPVEFYDQLRKTNFKVLLFNNSRTTLIAQVLSSLGDSGVDIIVLKGWAFIQTIYKGDASVRFCIDIDILIRPQDYFKAVDKLKGLGYHPVNDSWPGYAERYSNSQVYLSQNAHLPLQIGIHWGLLHRPFYDPNQVSINTLFSRAHSLNVAGVNVLELSIDDQIIYSCAHLGLHHKYDVALYRFYEIGFLLCQAGVNIDWHSITKRAQEWRCVIPMQRVFASLEYLWPGLIPNAVMDEVSQLSPVFLERFVNLWINKTKDRPSFDHLLVWITTPGIKQRFEIAFQDIFPSQKYMLKRYGPAPAGLWPLLYFKRLIHSFRLMRKKENI